MAIKREAADYNEKDEIIEFIGNPLIATLPRSIPQADLLESLLMLPPYKKSGKKVVFRPASNFSMAYYAQSGDGTMQSYFADPEENIRTNPVDVPWGTGNFEENQPVDVEE
jgi:hypothetical protein